LPTPVLFGPLGVLAPPDVIDNDSATRQDVEVPPATFDPAEDAIDFYEQYEGMLIELNNPVAVGPTNVGFGEVVVKPRGQSGYVRTPNGGVVYSSYESPNARRLVLDDVLIGAGNMPNVNTGDSFVGLVVGPLDYGFNNWRMYPTSIPTTLSGGTTRTAADPAAPRQLAVATFNVENLDPTDPQSKFDSLAAIVVDNLASPDIVALEEVQDDNGAVNDGTVTDDVTLTQFVTAIAAAGGPDYAFASIDPVDGADGGEPGGNIRVAFIYRTDRGLSFVERGEGDATTPTEATTIDGELALTLSPGRVNPQDSAAWAATRKPLAGEFEWRGEKLFVIANHFSSKGGDDPLFGRFQPPDRSSEVKRHLQAASVNEFVQELLDIDPDANIAVVGDLNDFEFSDTVKILSDDGADLADLIQYLRPGDRYTYVFEGNSQVLDHILVGPSLAPDIAGKAVKARRDYDVVHVNADFYDQVSDHDTQVVRLRFGSGQP
jgi:predicted extracellular nuclease